MELQQQEAEAPRPEHQVLFTTENVILIDKDQKIETRRLIAHQPSDDLPFATFRDGLVSWSGEPGGTPGSIRRCPYGVPGDTLWVRESWQLMKRRGDSNTYEGWEGKAPAALPKGWEVWHRSAVFDTYIEPEVSWRPNIFMPRWACKLLLRVEAVRAERLHAITDDGARAEGMADCEAYRALWDSINRKRAPFDSNPWCWVVRFSKLPSIGA